ncbi:MAG: VWA domain-containing protein [Treponema sp.]|jgi:Ca-activated chloride channel family protein|nr:VWA domain-containing protein [Treponema sp.]
MKKLSGFVLFFLISGALLFSSGLEENSSLTTRGRYAAERGGVIAPEDLNVDALISSFDYRYPERESSGDVEIYLFNKQSPSAEKDGLIQIGIQGSVADFAELPPLNLVFVLDNSRAMDNEKKAWLRDSLASFVKKARPVDSLSLVAYGEKAKIHFESARIDNPEKLKAFNEALAELYASEIPSGAADMEGGLSLGCEQALVNYSGDSINLVLFFSAGTELSSRLNRAQALSGDVRISLSWNNRNDLDLYVVTPWGETIWYGGKEDSSGGMLDVDMNVNGETTEPVENVFWENESAPVGTYRVFVNNYDYHGDFIDPSEFQVEVKNGNEYLRREGFVTGSGDYSTVDVCEFEYTGTEEAAPIYKTASEYRDRGITIAALGIGNGFDVELMKLLAGGGGGKFRYFDSREKIQTAFSVDAEFERLAVPAARNLDMEIGFNPEIEILETWGYENKVEDNRVFFQISSLNRGDHETIMVRYRIPGAENSPQEEPVVVSFKMSAADFSGEQREDTETSREIPAEDTSESQVGPVELGEFARLVKEAGEKYHKKDDVESSLRHIEETKKSLDMLRETAGENELFEAASKLLAAYVEQFSSALVPALPSQYVIRSWGVYRDCFWNIAALPWVYGDPYKWPLLYEANRDRLPAPNNPNWIEPGTVIDIPSLQGEQRAGLWEEGKSYPPLP